MARGTDRLIKKVTKFTTEQYADLSRRYGNQITDILEFPVKVIFAPFTLAFDIAGSAPRGFGVPELISKISATSVFVVAALGTYDIALDMGRKFICQRHCNTCNGWQALRCTMCKGSGKVHYQVKNYALKRGERPTAEHIANAIVDQRAELVHLPSAISLNTPLPSKECPTCDGTGVMRCPECNHKIQVRISADDIMEPPWKAYNVMRKMEYPYENIVHSMKDPSIAAFWLLTWPQIVGGIEYDDEVKQKIWWEYKESMRYDQLRDLVAKRPPGWEHLQEALITLDPDRARDDPVVVKNIPYYKAKKTLEADVMKLNPPPRPQNWGHWQDLNLPLNASSWSEEDLKDPKKLYEMTVLLNAQREMAEIFLDAQWESEWRQEKLNEMLEEKVRPYIKNADKGMLSEPIIIPPQNTNQKKSRGKRWFFF